MSAANVAIARRGYEAIARGDFGAIGDLLDPEVKWHGGDAGAPGSCHNRREALRFMRQAVAHGGLGRLVDVIDAGERVVVVLERPDPTDATLVLSANVTTFRNGKVVEMVAYPTPDEALAAAGGD